MPHTRILAIITGASRGYGRAVALRLANKILSNENAHVLLYLVARNVEQLKDTQTEVQRETQNNDRVQVVIEQADLMQCSNSFMTNFSQNIQKAAAEKLPRLDKIVIFQNAASLGQVTLPTWQVTRDEDLNSYFQLNMTAPFLLTSYLMNIYEERLHREAEAHLEMQIVNISSLAGIKPFPYAALYCTGKAARDMWFGCLAEEAKKKYKNPHCAEGCPLRVLNYAPGPMLTEMSTTLMNDTADDELREQLKTGERVDLAESADKLMTLLFEYEDKWVSGAHVDYFDPL